jgi:hypothetical protein
MRVFDPSKRVINPALLALQTGVLKPKPNMMWTDSTGDNGKAANIARDVRVGMGLGDGGDYSQGLSGPAGSMANFDPEPISSAALNIIDAITGFFGLGAGRKEADKIVPIQNQVVSGVIAPIAAAVNDPNANTLSYQSLQKMWDAITATEAKWLAFLHNTDWSDGRAAGQAETTLQPYFTDQKNKIQALMQTASTSIIQYVTGTPDVPGLVIPPIPGSGSSAPGPVYGPTKPPVSSSPLAAGFSTFVPVLLGVGLLWWFSQKRKGLY